MVLLSLDDQKVGGGVGMNQQKILTNEVVLLC